MAAPRRGDVLWRRHPGLLLPFPEATLTETRQLAGIGVSSAPCPVLAAPGSGCTWTVLATQPALTDSLSKAHPQGPNPARLAPLLKALLSQGSLAEHGTQIRGVTEPLPAVRREGAPDTEGEPWAARSVLLRPSFLN